MGGRWCPSPAGRDRDPTGSAPPKPRGPAGPTLLPCLTLGRPRRSPAQQSECPMPGTARPPRQLSSLHVPREPAPPLAELGRHPGRSSSGALTPRPASSVHAAGGPWGPMRPEMTSGQRGCGERRELSPGPRGVLHPRSHCTRGVRWGLGLSRFAGCKPEVEVASTP